MAEHAYQPLAVIQEDSFAVKEVVADENDLAGGRGLDRGTGWRCEVEAGVRVTFFPVEEAAQTESAGKGPVNGAVEHQIAGLAGAEGFVRTDLLLKLTIDAFEVFRVRCDVLLILQLDMLFRVVAVADSEWDLVSALQFDVFGASLGGQGDASYGNPALAIFTNDQQRLLAILCTGRIGVLGEGNYGNAAGDRLVQQAGYEALGLGGNGQAD